MLKFEQLMNLLEKDHLYQLAIQKANQSYAIKPFNITQLTPNKIRQFYKVIQNKYYHEKLQYFDGSWYENQLRIFVWLVVSYCQLHKKHIKEMNSTDWELFSQIFNHRNLDIIQFNCKCLIKTQTKATKWSSLEVQLLMSLISQKDSKKKWNEVAKDLFLRSKKKYFRTGKQCRQRWFNHLDPTKVKTAWTKQQDQILMHYILEHGKKWSNVVKMLGNTRTQHMVKNRFKSLYNYESKYYPQKKQKQIIKIMCNKLENDIDIKEKRKFFVKKEKISEEIYTFQMNKEETPKQLQSKSFENSNENKNITSTSIKMNEQPSNDHFEESPLCYFWNSDKNNNDVEINNLINNNRWDIQLN